MNAGRVAALAADVVDEFDEPRRIERAAHVRALDLMAAQAAQERRLLLRRHAVGDDALAQRVRRRRRSRRSVRPRPIHCRPPA
jgi:hypothetical protein